ncbi:MAG: proline--tRNA ligase [Candidatus Magnetoovum sp. WYHC-5]|nr:proline--tRNA ligase [Candidatus Magnetoovum sp. WYHC-5]
MYYSKTLIPTLKEVPSDAEAISHQLMLRAGYIRQLATGLYIYLPLAWRVINKINNIIRQEMNAIEAQELSMPVLHPAEVWQKTGRWHAIGDEMFRLKDRTKRDMCLAMTHEEIMAWLAAREIRSYRDMPQSWYQIQTKLRDEARPKSGILRTREFIMKDSYSFDVDNEALVLSYAKHAEAYHKIFKRCGLTFYQVESDTGMMGGSVSHEFMAPSPAGEDEVAICPNCGYAANVELAKTLPEIPQYEDMDFKEISTPNKKTVDEVSKFLNFPPEYFIKSLLVISNEEPVLALVRGDHTLHEKKLTHLIGNFRPAKMEEITNILGVEAGFIGPMGHKIKIIADPALSTGVYISGANKKDYHAKGIKPNVHFHALWHDIHVAKDNEKCHNCQTPIRVEKVIEIGNIFQLGTKYTEPLKAVYLNSKGEEKPIVMGSYGIGPARVAAAAIEQNHDEHGIIWPVSIAPFTVHLLPLNIADKQTMEVCEQLYKQFNDNSIDTLVDDRNERPGVKFKDADLIGIPYQLVLGAKSLKENHVEIKNRKTKEITKVSVDDTLKIIKNDYIEKKR